MKTIIYYKVNFYQKKSREDILEQLVYKDDSHPTETQYIFWGEDEAKDIYNRTHVATYVVYGNTHNHLCQGKILVKCETAYDENNFNYGSREYFKELDKLPHKETIIESNFPTLAQMLDDAALRTCYYYKDFLKCLLFTENEDEDYIIWCVYYQRNKKKYYPISYNKRDFTWRICYRYVARDKEPLSPEQICERVNTYVCLIGEIMNDLHNRKYERRDPNYKPSEDTFTAKAAKAGISTRTLYKRRKKFGEELTEEQLKPYRRGRKPKTD